MTDMLALLNPNRDAPPRHDLLGFPNRKFAEMKDAGGQCRVGLTDQNGIGQVIWMTRAAAGHDGNRDRVDSRPP